MSIEQRDLEDLIRRVAADVALDIYHEDEILARHKLTPNQLERIVKEPIFRQEVTEKRAVWHETNNAPDRIKTKAQLTTEQLIPTLAEAISNTNNPLSARVAGFTQLAKMGGVGGNDDKAGTSGGNQMTITINMGAQKLKFDAAIPDAKTIEGELA